MEPSHYTILFATLLMSVIIGYFITSTNISQTQTKKQKYDSAVDIATDDAVASVIYNVDSIGNPDDVAKKAYEAFFSSLYCSIGISNSPEIQSQIKGYIPAILFIDWDGYYISSLDEVTSGSQKTLDHVWHTKVNYTYEDEKYIYAFTLTDKVSVYTKAGNPVYLGSYRDMPDAPTFFTDGTFDKVRRTVIIDMLVKDISYYIDKHNRYAEQFGISYTFSLPDIPVSDWNRTIDDISFLAFFQGMPIAGSQTVLNHYALSVSRILKDTVVYVEFDESKIPYYHYKGCGLITNNAVEMTVTEAKDIGAYSHSSTVGERCH